MSGGGYFGFTPGGTQYGTGGYGAAASGYAASYTPTHPYAFTPVTAAAAYGSYGASAGSQPQTPQHQSQSNTGGGSYATRLDANTFSASNAGAGAIGMKSSSGSAGFGTGAKTGNPGNKGYDAAVYAAATSYLQSKAAGTGNQWLGMKRGGAAGAGGGIGGGGGRGGGGGGFPRRGGGANRSGGFGATQQLHYCEVCKISCGGPQTYREHLEGQKHKKKEAQAKSGEQQPLAKSKVSFRCDLCDVTCTGQDIYNAHVRGAKHQKTLKLHQTLGKPIPSTEPVIITPAGLSKAGAGGAAKKVIGVSTMNFVPGQKLAGTGAIGPQEISSNSTGTEQSALEAALALEKDIQPVGEDYVEIMKDHTGKIVQFFCKLCDCKFNDINAKDMHLKGRRHRLQFKLKVNPDLEVDMKPPSGRNRRGNDGKSNRFRQQDHWGMRGMYQGQMMIGGGMPTPLFPPMRSGQRYMGETSDDRHAMAKHDAVASTEEEQNAIQRVVANVEKALKGVSDHFAEEEQKKKAAAAATTTTTEVEKKPESPEAEKKDDDETKKEGEAEGESEKPTESERLLKGVMRVGFLAKGLLLKGDMNVSLVVLCSEKPTQRLLRKVFELLPKQLETAGEEKCDVRIGADKCSLIVTSSTEPKVVVTVILTSVLMREQEGEVANKPDEVDVLDKQKCLEALADLRHAKWFQARCSNLQSCLVTLRIMRDICQRITTWQPLSGWALELLVEKIMSSAGIPMSPGESLRRIFEAVSTGLLLPNGPGLVDPCEKDVTDVIANLSAQQREDITSSAQHALRLIAFNQLYKILGIDRLPDKTAGMRKRPLESAEGMEVDDENGKKDKKEMENGTAAAAAAAAAATTTTTTTATTTGNSG